MSEGCNLYIRHTLRAWLLNSSRGQGKIFRDQVPLFRDQVRDQVHLVPQLRDQAKILRCLP